MKLIIELNKETNQLSMGSTEPMQIDDLMNILFTVQLEAMRGFISQVESSNTATEQELQELKEHLYDQYNAGASNTLYLFIPDKELRPDLTVEAMKQAEDQYMYNQLNRESRREVDKKTKGTSKLLRFPDPTDDNHIPHVD